MAGRKSFSRTDRVRKEMIRELSDIIQHRVKDPLLNNIVISVTDVEISPDFQHAKVFISIFGEEGLRETIMGILEDNRKLMRQELGARVRLRYTPELELRYDDSLERGARVTELLNQISRGEI
jgi:ribosome-binding factor A